MSLVQQHRQALSAITAQGQDLEVIEQSISGHNFAVFNSIPATLGEFFQIFMAAHADKPCTVYQGHTFTYGEQLERATALANALVQKFGVEPGDRVVIAMRNYPEWITAYIAITSIGAIAVTVNAWWQQDELRQSVKLTGATVAVCDDKYHQMLTSIGTVTSIAVRDANHQPLGSFDQMLAQYQGETMPTFAVAPSHDAVIMFTSGSTGFPKGAVSTHRAVLTAIFSFALYGAGLKEIGVLEDNPEAKTAILVTIPLFHVTGCNCMFLLSVLQGRKIVLMHKWHIDDALQLIERERITTFQGVPTMSLELLNSPNRHKYDLSSLQDISAGGAARPADHVKRLSDAFEQAPPSLGYGLTETNAVGFINVGEDYLFKPGSCGVVSAPIVSCDIRDDSGRSLPAGEVGEICIKSAANIKGYWLNPKATKQAFTDDGYFKTGDVGYLDEEGFLTIVDRIKEIIIRGGENISCLELESVASELPSITEVVAFGVPDERLGELVAISYVDEYNQVNEGELVLHIAKRLAPFKVPQFVFASRTPFARVASGKIDRLAVTASCLDQLIEVIEE